HYCWTPAGCVYVPGFWDYPLAERGLPFAPVYFCGPAPSGDWSYSPDYAIAPNGLLSSLFVNPLSNSYYFGDYSDPFYRGLGFSSWYGYASRFHDPLFGHYRWRHRGE